MLDDAGALGVFAVGDDGRASFLPVEVVDQTGEGAWVDGLPDSLRLVVVGDGARVSAVDESAVDGGGGASP